MAVTHTITGGLVHLSGNPIEVVLTASAPRDNHRLAVKVKCDQLLFPVQIEEQEPIIEVDDLLSRFNIQGLVNEPLPIEFLHPMTGVASGHGALVLIVTLEIGEVWDDENGDRQEEWTLTNDIIRVINGRLRNYELALLNDANKSFNSEYIEGGKFRSLLPNNMVVSPQQVVKLWYMSRWFENHAVTLFTAVTLNNKVGHLPLQENIMLYPITGLLELSLNPIIQGFELDPGEQIEKFEVWLEDAQAKVSERRTFVVDNNYYERSYFGYYRNEFSAIESFWLRGESKEKLKTESESAYKPAAVGAGSKVPTMITVSSGSRRYWELNTGIRSRTEMLAMRELLEAQECWLVDPDNTTKLIPVTMESSDALLYDSMEDIQSLEITLFEAHKK